MAIIYETMGSNDKAIEYLHKALEINERINVTTRLLTNYEHLAWIYEKTKNINKAIEFREKMVELDKFDGLKRLEADLFYLKKLQGNK